MLERYKTIRDYNSTKKVNVKITAAYHHGSTLKDSSPCLGST